MEPLLSYPSRSLGLIKEPHQASLLHLSLWKYLQYYLQSPKYQKGQFCPLLAVGQVQITSWTLWRAFVGFGFDTEIITDHIIQHILLFGGIIAAEKPTGCQLHQMKWNLTKKAILEKQNRPNFSSCVFLLDCRGGDINSVVLLLPALGSFCRAYNDNGDLSVQRT